MFTTVGPFQYFRTGFDPHRGSHSTGPMEPSGPLARIGCYSFRLVFKLNHEPTSKVIPTLHVTIG